MHVLKISFNSEEEEEELHRVFLFDLTDGTINVTVQTQTAHSNYHLYIYVHAQLAPPNRPIICTEPITYI